MEHNKGVDYVMSNLTYIPNNSKDIKKEVSTLLARRDRSVSLKSTSVESIANEIPDFPDSFEDVDVYEWINQMIFSEKLKEAVRETLESLKTFSSVEELDITLKNKEKKAASLFEGDELEFYYKHLAIARYSTLYWNDSSIGGQDGFVKARLISYNLNGNPHLKRVNWWKVLAVDCIGGWMGGPAGYIGGSAIAVIMQL